MWTLNYVLHSTLHHEKKLEEEKRVKYVLTYLHITLNYILDSAYYILTSTTKTLNWIGLIRSVKQQKTPRATGNKPLNLQRWVLLTFEALISVIQAEKHEPDPRTLQRKWTQFYWEGLS